MTVNKTSLRAALRKAAALCLCLAAAASCLALPAGAAGDGPLKIGSARGFRGDAVSVDVTLDASAGAASGGFTLTYDTRRLQLLDAREGELMEGRACFINKEYGPGAIRVSFAGGEAIAASGTLVSLSFRIDQRARLGTAEITASNVKLSDVGANAVITSAGAGGVTVEYSPDEAAVVFTAPARVLSRDYGQSFPVDVENVSDMAVNLYLEADNPYGDVFLNFVSGGSREEPVTVLPGETRTVYMSVFLQNAVLGDYRVPVTPYAAYGGGSYAAMAAFDACFSCHIPSFSLDIAVKSTESSTLATVFSLKNTGENITDLTLTLGGDAAAYARFTNGVENCPLRAGETVEAQIIPNLAAMKEDGVSRLNGTLTASSCSRAIEYGFVLDTGGREITVTTSHRMALYQRGNPYWQLTEEPEKAVSTMDGLTGDNWRELVGEDGSFTMESDHSFSYGGSEARVSVTMTMTPSSSAPDGSLTFVSEDRDGTLVRTVKGTLGEEEGLAVLSGIYTDLAGAFGIGDSPSRLAARHAGMGNMDLKIGITVADPIVGNTLSMYQNSGKLGSSLFGLYEGIGLAKNLGDTAGIVMDVVDYCVDPSLSAADRMGYILLGLGEAATIWLDDPTGGSLGDGWYSSGWGTGFGILKDMHRTATGKGRDSHLSNEQLGDAIMQLARGRQCTNAGEVTSEYYYDPNWLRRGLRASMYRNEVYHRMQTGQINERNCLELGGSGRKYNSASLADEDDDAVALLWMTGRMESPDHDYVNREATGYAVLFNGQTLGEVENGGLTDVFSVGILTSSVNAGSNRVTRKYNTNPGTHYVTADTEYSTFIPFDTPVAYIGSMDEYPAVSALPDFAVYPENITVGEQGSAPEAVEGRTQTVSAAVFNRGQRGGWADAAVFSGDTELYREENLYIAPFSGAVLSFEWTPAGGEEELTVRLENTTVYVGERTAENNEASCPVRVRAPQEPEIISVGPRSAAFLTADDVTYLTADVKNFADVTRAEFTVDGATPEGGVTSSEADGGVRYSLQAGAGTLSPGTHTVAVRVYYLTDEGEKSVYSSVECAAGFHDCDAGDPHVLRTHNATEPQLGVNGTIRYDYCAVCGRLFSADGEELTREQTLTPPLAADVQEVSRDGDSAAVRVRLDARLPRGIRVFVASYGAGGRMLAVKALTAEETEAARAAAGTVLQLAAGNEYKAFAADEDLRPAAPDGRP